MQNIILTKGIKRNTVSAVITVDYISKTIDFMFSGNFVYYK